MFIFFVTLGLFFRLLQDGGKSVVYLIDTHPLHTKAYCTYFRLYYYNYVDFSSLKKKIIWNSSYSYSVKQTLAPVLCVKASWSGTGLSMSLAGSRCWMLQPQPSRDLHGRASCGYCKYTGDQTSRWSRLTCLTVQETQRKLDRRLMVRGSQSKLYSLSP